MDAVPVSPNRLLAALPGADFLRLRPHLETVLLVQGDLLVGAGKQLTKVYFPHNGVISLVVSLADGRMVEVAMVGRDSVFGGTTALDGNISLTDAIVQLSGVASTLAVKDLQAAAEQSVAFRTTLIRHEQALFAQAQQAAACNAMHSTEARLARWLLRTHDLVGDDKLHLTQDFLAQMIGVQRNSVSTVAHMLQQAGTIKYARGHIEITDIEALEKASCECYQSVKIQYKRLLNEG